MANNYFDAASQGYVNVQQQLSQLGLMGGSMQPMDGRGAAVQIPTLPPPNFTTQVASTASFPTGPASSGVAPLPYGLSAPQMSSFAGHAGPPQPLTLNSMGSALHMPQFMGYPSPPPMPAPMPIGGSFGGGIGGYLADRSIAAGGAPPPMGGNIIRARADAASRVSRTTGDIVGHGLEWGTRGAAVTSGLMGIGAMAASTGWGAIAGVPAMALSGVLMAGDMMASGYNQQRSHVRKLRQTYGGLTMGNMVDPTGLGMSVGSAMQVSGGLADVGRSIGMSKGAMMSVGGAAQGMGLLRGHTNTASDLVSRIKTLAQVTKTITDLGEGISAGDALQLQALSQEMGMGAGVDMASMGRRLVTAARVTGQTLGGITQGAAGAAGMYSSLGMSGAAGMQTGAVTTTQGAVIANSGRLSNRQLARMGGAAGISGTLLQSQAAFDAKAATPLVYGAMEMTSAGTFRVNQDRLNRIARGEISLKDAEKRGRDFLTGKADDSKGLTKHQLGRLLDQFNRQKADLVADAQEKLNPSQRQNMQLTQIKDLMERKNLTFRQGAVQVTGSTQAAEALEALVKDPNVRMEQQKQQSLQRREAIKRAAAGPGPDHSTLSGIGRWFGSPFRAMGDVGSKIGGVLSRAEHEDRRAAAGLYDGTLRGSERMSAAEEARVWGGRSAFARMYDRDRARVARDNPAQAALEVMGGRMDKMGIMPGAGDYFRSVAAHSAATGLRRPGTYNLDTEAGSWGVWSGASDANKLMRKIKGDWFVGHSVKDYFTESPYERGDMAKTFDRYASSGGALREMLSRGSGESGLDMAMGIIDERAMGLDKPGQRDAMILARGQALNYARGQAQVAQGKGQKAYSEGSTEGLTQDRIMGSYKAALREQLKKQNVPEAEREKIIEQATTGRDAEDITGSIYKSLSQDKRYRRGVSQFFEDVDSVQGFAGISGLVTEEAYNKSRKREIKVRQNWMDHLSVGEMLGGGDEAADPYFRELAKTGLSEGALKMLAKYEGLDKIGDMSQLSDSAKGVSKKDKKFAREIMDAVARGKAGKKGAPGEASISQALLDKTDKIAASLDWSKKGGYGEHMIGEDGVFTVGLRYAQQNLKAETDAQLRQRLGLTGSEHQRRMGMSIWSHSIDDKELSKLGLGETAIHGQRAAGIAGIEGAIKGLGRTGTSEEFLRKLLGAGFVDHGDAKWNKGVGDQITAYRSAKNDKERKKHAQQIAEAISQELSSREKPGSRTALPGEATETSGEGGPLNQTLQELRAHMQNSDRAMSAIVTTMRMMSGVPIYSGGARPQGPKKPSWQL